MPPTIFFLPLLDTLKIHIDAASLDITSQTPKSRISLPSPCLTDLTRQSTNPHLPIPFPISPSPLSRTACTLSWQPSCKSSRCSIARTRLGLSIAWSLHTRYPQGEARKPVFLGIGSQGLDAGWSFDVVMHAHSHHRRGFFCHSDE